MGENAMRSKTLSSKMYHILERTCGTAVQAFLVPLVEDHDSLSDQYRTYSRFVQGPTFVHKVRHLLNAIEQPLPEGLGLHSYHLQVIPTASRSMPVSKGRKKRVLLKIEDDVDVDEAARTMGFAFLVCGNYRQGREVPDADGLTKDLDQPMAYSDASGRHFPLEEITPRDCLVAEGRFVRCFLDAQARPVYIVTCQRFVRRQTELSDEELSEFWSLGLQVLQTEHGCCDHFQDIRVNAGSFQNVSHLHLKIYVNEEVFTRRWEHNPVYQKLRAANRMSKQKREAAT